MMRLPVINASRATGLQLKLFCLWNRTLGLLCYRTRRSQAYGILCHSTLGSLDTYDELWRDWADDNPFESAEAGYPFSSEVEALVVAFNNMIIDDTWMTPRVKHHLAETWKHYHAHIGCTSRDCSMTDPVRLAFDDAISDMTFIEKTVMQQAREELYAAEPIIAHITRDPSRLNPGCWIPDRCLGGEPANRRWHGNQPNTFNIR